MKVSCNKVYCLKKTLFEEEFSWDIESSLGTSVKKKMFPVIFIVMMIKYHGLLIYIST